MHWQPMRRSMAGLLCLSWQPAELQSAGRCAPRQMHDAGGFPDEKKARYMAVAAH
jgi:hypothetical protein